ncbi:MAG: MaoC/PaaZ C-terminal domain-containing protein [Chloroflexi bacterium]|nr:MaoC/PaaZ C-terminal domain-containing protein [Chloroflexota bacterium]
MVLRASELTVGDSRDEVVVDNLTRTQIVQYAGASGDFNPLHTDDLYAREVAGYPGVFAHGMLGMGLLGKALTSWVGDGRLTSFGVRFRAQIWPGDTLTARLSVSALRTDEGVPYADITAVVVNQDGAEVIAGNATARLDP